MKNYTNWRIDERKDKSIDMENDVFIADAWTKYPVEILIFLITMRRIEICDVYDAVGTLSAYRFIYSFERYAILSIGSLPVTIHPRRN